MVNKKDMFIGEYKHTIDDKNRISLPAKFRKELGKKIVVSRGLDNCLFLFTSKAWEAISQETAKLGHMQVESRGFNRFLFSGATDIEVDSMGRILLPDYLRSFAGLKSSVIFAGVHNRIEIWDDKRWDGYKKRIESEAENMAEKLSQIGLG